MIRFTAVLSANPAPASANTRPRQTLRFGDFASEIASSLLTIVLIDNERGGRGEGRKDPMASIWALIFMMVYKNEVDGRPCTELVTDHHIPA